MNVALVGNNDGPLVLLRSMRAAELNAVCVGLQNASPPALRKEYEDKEAPHYFEGFSEERLLKQLVPLDVDVLVNCFCNFRFCTLLNEYDVLNVHLAPLPRYRGRHSVQWALINGEREFGVTIHRMTEAWDAGAILWQRQVPVDFGMSVRALRERLLDAVGDDFGVFLKRYAAGDIEPRSNRDDEATYAARRFPEDSRLTDWSDRDRVVRKVMALRSEDYPAFCEMGGERVVARWAEAGARRYAGLAAPFVCAVRERAIEIACVDGRTVVLGDLEPASPPVHVNQRLD